MLAFTIKILRDGHKFITLLYFVPFVWVVTITSYIVETFLVVCLEEDKKYYKIFLNKRCGERR